MIMKKNILVLLGIIVLLSGCLEGPKEIVQPPAPELSSIHLNPASVPSATCLEKDCHSVDKQKSLSEEIKTTHVRHLQSTMLKLECSTCHERIDTTAAQAGFEIRDGSIIRSADKVNYNTCAKCHKFMPETNPAKPYMPDVPIAVPTAGK